MKKSINIFIKVLFIFPWFTHLYALESCLLKESYNQFSDCFFFSDNDYNIAGIDAQAVVVGTDEFTLFEDALGNIYLTGNALRYDPIANRKPWHLDCLNNQSLSKEYAGKNELLNQLRALGVKKIAQYSPQNVWNKKSQTIFRGKLFSAIFTSMYYDRDTGGRLMKAYFVVVKNQDVISEIIKI